MGEAVVARWSTPVSGTSQYKKILRHIIKPKVSVKVGRKVAEMTDTQAYRFAELSQGDAELQQEPEGNPFEQLRYSLEEAAFRLMIDEDEILRRAASGTIGLYVNAAGFEGRWRRLDASGNVRESSMRTLRCGYLALTELSCRDLASNDNTRILLAELPASPVDAGLELDGETLQELSAWGGEKKCFCLHETRTVSRSDIALLAPLSAGKS